MVVVGAVWTIIYNADLLLGAACGRPRAGPRACARSCAWRSRIRCAARFRTGMTLAMFTLVVFTLVAGDDLEGLVHRTPATTRSGFGGGFDVRASTAAAAPDRRHAARALARRRAPAPRDFPVVASQSYLPVEARQLRTGRGRGDLPGARPRRRLPRAHHVRPGVDGRGYATPREVWRALARAARAWRSSTPSSRTATTSTSPRCRPTSSSPASTSRTAHFDPVRVEVPRPADRRRAAPHRHRGAERHRPLEMAGISTSQRRSPRHSAAGRADDPLPRGRARRRSDRRRGSSSPRSSPSASRPIRSQELLDDAIAAPLTFNRLVLGFLGLGLVVGVAALGVDQRARRRRAPPAHRRAPSDRVPAADGAGGFLLESSFLALTSIVLGTALGLAVAFNIISDPRAPAELGEPVARRAVGEPRRHLRRRLRGRAARDAGAGPCARRVSSRRGAALPVGATRSWPHPYGSVAAARHAWRGSATRRPCCWPRSRARRHASAVWSSAVGRTGAAVWRRRRRRAVPLRLRSFGRPLARRGAPRQRGRPDGDRRALALGES